MRQCLNTNQRSNSSFAVADDNPAIAGLVAATLAMQGYQVLEAHCGTEVLEAVERHDKLVDLLRTRCREWTELGCGGRSMRSSPRPGSFHVGERYARRRCAPLLSKPFTPPKLVRIVRDTLQSRRFPYRQSGVA
jgi:CheY-like chemotaxis protein